MNLNPLRREQPAQDLDAIANQTDQLGQRIEQEIGAVVRTRRAYPPEPQPRERTPLELIAAAITRLTWADAEKMGDAIASATKDGALDAKKLTAAIQAWAASEAEKQQ